MLNRHLLKTFAVLLFISSASFAQTLPYFNLFNDAATVTGWTHYAVTGTDDWVLTPAFGTYPESWKTGSGDMQQPGERMLETPEFNLTNVTDPVLTINHKTSGTSLDLFKLEYTIDNGTTWQLLTNTVATKLNWMGTAGFASNYSNATKSCISLAFLNSPAAIKFRFRCITVAGGNGFGWMLKDFYLGPKQTDYIAQPGLDISTATTCSSFTVSTAVVYNSTFEQGTNFNTKYFLSPNNVLDAGDTEIGIKTGTINASGTVQYNKELSLPPGTQPGIYYILYKYDSDNAIAETNENDNVGMAKINVRAVLSVPYFEDFETPSLNSWITYISQYADDDLLWSLGQAWRHHYTGAYSGTHAWHTSNTYNYTEPLLQPQWVESPFLDLSQVAGPKIISMRASGDDTFVIQYSTGCSETWTDLETTGGGMHDWDIVKANLPDAIANLPSVRFRIQYQMVYTLPEGVAFDDVYVGPNKPDIIIAGRETERFTPSSQPEMTFYYTLQNSVSNNDEFTSHTEFYWSADNVLDTNDILLGTKQEADPNITADFLTTYTFTKPTTAVGNYYLLCKLDAQNEHDERLENNNLVTFLIKQTEQAAFPYYNDFETQANNWEHSATLNADDWHWGTAGASTLNTTAFSGSKGLIAANSNGRVTPMSRMHYYSPVFNLTATDKPILEFDMHYVMNLNSELNLPYGGVSISCSFDGGQSWHDINNTLIKSNMWFDTTGYDFQTGLDVHLHTENRSLFNNSSLQLKPSNDYNGRDCDRTTHYVADLSDYKQVPNIRFRLNVGLMNNNSEPNWKGETECVVLVDNFSVAEATKDLAIQYTKELQISALSQKIKFFANINNLGNSPTNPAIAKFYVSADNVLDASDYLLGETPLPAIRPDNKAYINTAFNAPANLGSYQYLIYNLDAGNANTETNESNNTGAWPLALNSQGTYPYLNEFNDAVVNGWHHYCTNSVNSTVLNTNYRVRNTLAPNEGDPAAYIGSYPENGVFATERISPDYFNSIPHAFYLEGPSFNFATENANDPLFVSFEFYCIGRNSSTGGTIGDGGTLQYSTDGGTTWNVLEDPNNTFYNYNNNNPNMPDPVSNLGCLGWHHSQPVYVQASCSLAFLAGQQDVVFRYKYCSNFQNSPQTANGLRIKNFKIGTAQQLSLPVTESYKKTWFSCYPNPASDVLNITSDEFINTIELYGATGQKVLTRNVNGNNTVIDLSNYSKGIYLLKVMAGKKTETTKILVK